jgi:hypothetical protein
LLTRAKALVYNDDSPINLWTLNMNATFNPAFVNVSGMSNRAVQQLGHVDDIDHQPRVDAASLTAAARSIDRYITSLSQAAERYAARRDNFAIGKAETCRDIAAKLRRFGAFASDSQQQYAYKLIGWAAGYGQPHPWEAQEAPQEAAGGPVAPVVAPSPAPAPVVRLDRLHAVMQGMAKLVFRRITLARKNGDQLVWVKATGQDGVIGRLDHGVLTIFAGRLRGMTTGEVEAILKLVNLDPEAAAAADGRASGRCCVCSRDLTDPASIERGIGPICAAKFF